MEYTKKWLSAEEVAKQVKVSPMTIKRNCQTYKEFVNFRKGEKNKYLIDEECVSVFLFINKMRNKRNLQSGQIIELMEKEGFLKFLEIPIVHTPEHQSEQTQLYQGFVPVQEVEKLVSEQVSLQLKKHEEVLKEWLMEQQLNQQEFQRGLLQRLDNRDQKLVHALREIQESKKEIAVSIQKEKGQQQKKWWKFW
ncbi:DUF3967 domain-containing protein [Priestia flexa]|uniref:DUF3967 domain-containing protein n=1 Tax=Priestia flexa TaxID=86664 RepID=UPI003F86D8D0